MVSIFSSLCLPPCPSNLTSGGSKYSGTARHIAASGYAVYAMDYPGFGLSEGLHGYIPSFDQLVDDVIEQYKKFKGLLPLYSLYVWIILLTIISESTCISTCRETRIERIASFHIRTVHGRSYYLENSLEGTKSLGWTGPCGSHV